MRDLKWIIGLLGICILILAIVTLFFPAVSAEEVALSDQTIYPYNEPYRIMQGQNVYVNDTIDIAGIGWPTGLAWYGKYQEYDQPQYIYEFTNFRRSLQNFYLDPAIFEGKSGVWYQYYGNLTERNGNLDAFKIVNAYRNQTATYPNGTVIETKHSMSNVTPEYKVKPEPVVPEIGVSDYLLALGDPLQIDRDRVWVFGRTDGIYAHSGNFTVGEIQQLSPGYYKIVTHDAGKNTVVDVGFDTAKDSFWMTEYDLSTGPKVTTESILGSQPMLDIDKFYWMIKKTDDKVQTYDMVVEEPEVSIVSIDEVDVGNKIPIAWEPGMTLLDVRGYTNTAAGTKLTFIMDPDDQTARTLRANTYTTLATRTSPGNKSMYQVYIPINKNSMPNGMHTLLVNTPLGGSMRSDFPISELPADSYVPNATLKYIGDRNPWIPTPTPEVIIKKEVITVPGPVVTVIVTPSNEQVRAQQEVVTNDKIGFWIPRIITATIGLIVLLYLISVWLRSRKK